jgi:hypothetical protein
MEQAPLALWGRAAAVVVLALAAFDLIVRHTTPLTAVWLAGLAVAILLESGRPSRLRTWLGRGVAAAMGVLAAVVLIEHLASKSLGPPPRTAASSLYLSGAVLLMRVDRRRTGFFWGIFLLAAVATPLATVMGHMFKAVSDVMLTESTGQRISTAIAVLLLVAATMLARPDRNPLAWLLTRPDRWALLRVGRHPGRSASAGRHLAATLPGARSGHRGGLDSGDDDRHPHRRRGRVLPEPA